MLRLLANAARGPLISAIRSASYDQGQKFPVAVIGAAGGIGQSLSLLLRINPLVSTLTLYDLKGAAGVAADLSHIDVKGLTIGLDCPENLKKAVACSKIVIVPAGMPRKPGQSRADLFKVNADVVAEIADAIAETNPEAYLCIITNPVNSTVPVAAEIFKKRGVFNPSRLFGITTLDIVRSRKFVGDKQNDDPKRYKIKVIGGHSATTIVPLLSSCEPSFRGDDDEIIALTDRIRNAGNEIVEAKAGSGSATLSMAYAGSLFVDSLLNALNGKEGITEIAYVESCVTDVPYFASAFTLTKDGIGEFEKLPRLSKYEDKLLCEALPIIKEDIETGVAHGQAYSPKNKSK